jgi:hypothetical protein
VLVFDTSAYINGQRDHLPLPTFPSVWKLIEEAIDDGRIVLPREVFRELTAQDDTLAAWIHVHASAAVTPSEEVQLDAGRIGNEFPAPGIRNGADPFIVAEARARRFTVVTYEGRSFSGVPTRRWARTMPGICQRFGVHCCTLPEALTLLGAEF